LRRDEVESVPEYGWQSSEAAASHGYLSPKILDIVNNFISSNTAYPRPRVFDAGCGNGFLAGQLIERGYDVSGCDASEEGVRQASLKYPQGRFEKFSVYEDVSGHFGDEWDLVVSSEVIEHLYDPRMFIRNIHSLLRNDGMLVITTPYHGYLKNLVMALSGKMDAHFTALWDGGHIKFWSLATLTELLKETGFHDIHFYGAGRLPLLWKSMILTARK